MDQDLFDDDLGNPSPEDLANGAAALAAGLCREAQVLAETAAHLHDVLAALPGDGASGPLSDIRRHRLVMAVAGEAAVKAALLNEAAEALGRPADLEALAAAMLLPPKRLGLPATMLVAPLRAAALAVRTDDGAARVVASLLAKHLAERLEK